MLSQECREQADGLLEQFDILLDMSELEDEDFNRLNPLYHELSDLIEELSH